MRKFAELPFHLIGSNRVQDLCDNVLFNYHWLHSKISAVPIMNILEDFSHALTVIKDPILRRQVTKSLAICCLMSFSSHFGNLVFGCFWRRIICLLFTEQGKTGKMEI